MYIPSHFREARLPVLQDMIRQHPLATLITSTADGPEANHVPMLFDAAPEPFGRLRGHVARANPVWQRTPSGATVLVVFLGASQYVSPGWYPSKKAHGRVVPTWNYIAVHARGAIEWIHDAYRLRDLVGAITEEHERLQPEPWRLADAPADFLDRMLEAIVGFEIVIDDLAGKWKLSQNRDVADQEGVLAAVAALDTPGAREMAALMQSGVSVR